MQKNLIILILLLILAWGIGYFVENKQSDTSLNSTATSTMKVKLALLGEQTENSNKDNFRGCDVFYLQEIEVPYSQAPLTVALKELFSTKDLIGNFITSQTELFFDKVNVENGVAKIYLLGKIGPLNGVCDDPRLRIQLEETALQFETIQKVEFYLNGEKTDLTFSQKGN